MRAARCRPSGTQNLNAVAQRFRAGLTFGSRASGPGILLSRMSLLMLSISSNATRLNIYEASCLRQAFFKHLLHALPTGLNPDIGLPIQRLTLAEDSFEV